MRSLVIGLVALTLAIQPERTAVWIDADPAVGVKDRDVDDGFAMVQAFNSPEIAVRGPPRSQTAAPCAS